MPWLLAAIDDLYVVFRLVAILSAKYIDVQLLLE